MAKAPSAAMQWFMAMTSVTVGVLLAGTVMAGVNKALSAGGVTEFFPTSAATNGGATTSTASSTNGTATLSSL